VNCPFGLTQLDLRRRGENPYRSYTELGGVLACVTDMNRSEPTRQACIRRIAPRDISAQLKFDPETGPSRPPAHVSSDWARLRHLRQCPDGRQRLDLSDLLVPRTRPPELGGAADGVKIVACRSKDCENFGAATHTAISPTCHGKPGSVPTCGCIASASGGAATYRAGALQSSSAKLGGWR